MFHNYIIISGLTNMHCIIVFYYANRTLECIENDKFYKDVKIIVHVSHYYL